MPEGNGTYTGADVPPATKVDVSGDPPRLKSKWPVTRDLAGSVNPCRLEGEVADLVVLGTVPPQLDGVFYRVMCDPFVPPHPGNVPIDGE
jgi:hypothetical protein